MDKINEVKELATKIYNITNSLNLSGIPEKQEEDITAYINMIEARQPLIEKLQEYKESFDAETISSPEFYIVSDIIGDIAKLDEKHNDSMEDLREVVLVAIRKIKAGQKIHKGYKDLPPDMTSYRFDTKH